MNTDPTTSTEEEAQELRELQEEWDAYKDHPERDAGERFQDKYDMYRNEY